MRGKVSKKRVLCFLISIPLAFIIHSAIVIDLLDFIAFFSLPGYLFVFMLEILLCFELLVLIFDDWKKQERIGLLCCYEVLLLFVLLYRQPLLEMHVELNPLSFLQDLDTSHDRILALANIGLFVPMIILQSVLIKKLSMNILVSILLALFLELLQLVTRRGMFDLGDILLYLIGLGCSVVLYCFLRSIHKLS